MSVEQAELDPVVESVEAVDVSPAPDLTDPIEMARKMVSDANIEALGGDVDTSVATEEATDDAQAVSTDENSGEEEQHEASVLERAQALGVADSLAKSFSSVPELERYVRLRDIESGITDKKPAEEVPAVEERPSPAKAEAKPAPVVSEETPLNIDVEQLREDGESDHVIQMAETLIAQSQQLKTLQSLLEGSNPQELATRFQAIEQRYQQELHQQVVDHFDTVVDGLNLPEFGKTIDKSGKVAPLSETALVKRQELWDAATTLAEIQQKKGNDMPIEVLVQRSLLQLMSPAEQEAQVRKKVVGKLSKQSNGRLGAPAGTGKPVAKDSPDATRASLVEMANRMIR